MKEALVIILVLLALLALTAFRYRRQLAVMLNVWRTLKSIKQARNPASSQIPDIPAAVGPLASCPKCGTWMPQDKAIRLGRNSYYCSTECAEKSAASI